MKIIVKYWLGTTQFTGTARTYRGAMRIASRNQNAYPPTFFDEKGVQLWDDGNGLAYQDCEVGQNGVERRVYAV